MTGLPLNWQVVDDNWVLLPPQPVAVVHFLGGALVATAPQVTYCRLLESLGSWGCAVIATPFINTLNHTAIADRTLRSFERTLRSLQTTAPVYRHLPVYGMGHSLGGKLHLLIGSLFPGERLGNILISTNNFSARSAVPLGGQFSGAVEFTPSPERTLSLVAEAYRVQSNLLIKFTNDDLDQTLPIAEVLRRRFGTPPRLRILNGSHLTPLGRDVNWQMGSTFTPFDAIGQWMRQEVYRELQQLERTILAWLDVVNASLRSG